MRKGFKPLELNVAARFTSNLQAGNGPTTPKDISASTGLHVYGSSCGGRELDRIVGSVYTGTGAEALRLIRVRV